MCSSVLTVAANSQEGQEGMRRAVVLLVANEKCCNFPEVGLVDVGKFAGRA